LLAESSRKFHYLKVGLGIVLSFIGVKMLLPLLAKLLAAACHVLGYQILADWAHGVDDIPIGIALGIVAAVLLASVGASLIWPQKHIEKHNRRLRSKTAERGHPVRLRRSARIISTEFSG